MFRSTAIIPSSVILSLTIPDHEIPHDNGDDDDDNDDDGNDDDDDDDDDHYMMNMLPIVDIRVKATSTTKATGTIHCVFPGHAQCCKLISFQLVQHE